MADTPDSSTAENPVERFFFIHIQKTAGTSLRQHLLANFNWSEIYPPQQENDLGGYLVLYQMGGFLVGLPAAEQARYRLFHGHVPYAVTQRLALDTAPTTITVLREPIARILSALNHKKRHRAEFANASLEEIYNNQKIFQGQLLNHQAKIFAVPNDSDLLSGYDPYPVGPEQLELAKENLNRVDVIGLQSDMPAFLAELQRKFGWETLKSDVRENVGSQSQVSQSFLDRIAADNEIDLAFYRYAQELVATRAAAR